MRRDRDRDRVAKLCGADIELGNFILGLERAGGTGREASRALLREIDAPYADRGGYGVRLVRSASGYQMGDGASGATYDPQGRGRKDLSSNGGRLYIHPDHPECCPPPGP